MICLQYMTSFTTTNYIGGFQFLPLSTGVRVLSKKFHKDTISYGTIIKSTRDVLNTFFNTQQLLQNVCSTHNITLLPNNICKLVKYGQFLTKSCGDGRPVRAAT